MAATSIGYIRKCNDLLQAMMDSKIVHFKAGRDNKKGLLLDNSKNIQSVHLVHRIFWEDKERKLAEPELKRKKVVIGNKSDIELAGKFRSKYLKDKGLLR